MLMSLQPISRQEGMADGSPHPSQPLKINAALPPSNPNLDTQTLLEDSKLSSGQEKPSLAATIVNEVIKDLPLSQSALPTSIHSNLDGMGSMPVVTHFKPAIQIAMIQRVFEHALFS